MSEPTKPIPPTDADTARELAQIEYEPLLPVEKQLIAGSLILGVLLLGILLWVTSRYVPTGS